MRGDWKPCQCGHGVGSHIKNAGHCRATAALGPRSVTGSCECAAYAPTPTPARSEAAGGEDIARDVEAVADFIGGQNWEANTLRKAAATIRSLRQQLAAAERERDVFWRLYEAERDEINETLKLLGKEAGTDLWEPVSETVQQLAAAREELNEARKRANGISAHYAPYMDPPYPDIAARTEPAREGEGGL